VDVNLGQSVGADHRQRLSVSTSVSGDAGSGAWPASRSFSTSFEPMRPLPPLTTIFIRSPFD
jgi:hypothetical protein